MIRVGVIGAAGRMGQTVVHAVDAADDLVVSCVVDPRIAEVAVPPDVTAATSVDGLGTGAADVLVDFSVADAARGSLVVALEAGYHVVSGTTGLSPEDLDSLTVACEIGKASALVAPNFALGAVLAMRFAASAARFFEGVEVIELHHDRKVDAPSGTSLATAQQIASARDAAGLGECHDPTTTVIVEGARGANGPGGVRIHSVRLPGLIAHEEIILASPGEALTLRHDSWDRTSFMAGVLLAVRTAPSRRGLTVGLDSLLDD